DEGCYVVDGHCVRTIHAEMNAILQCAKFGVSTEGAEMYVTHFPCLQCCKSIIQSGIQTVYYAQDYKNDPYAVELYKAADVTTKKVELEEHIFDTERDDKLALTKELLRKLDDSHIDQSEIQKLSNE